MERRGVIRLLRGFTHDEPRALIVEPEELFDLPEDCNVLGQVRLVIRTRDLDQQKVCATAQRVRATLGRRLRTDRTSEELRQRLDHGRGAAAGKSASKKAFTVSS